MVSYAMNFLQTFVERIKFEKQLRLTGQSTFQCYFAAGKKWTNDETKGNSIVFSKTIDIIPAGCSYLQMWIMCIATKPDELSLSSSLSVLLTTENGSCSLSRMKIAYLT